MSQARIHHYTYADYVGVEMTSSTKHELLDGEIYAMVGGTEDHSAEVTSNSSEAYDTGAKLGFYKTIR